MSEVVFNKRDHRYYLDKKEYPSYSKIMKHFNMTPDYDSFGSVEARDRGTDIHDLTSLYDQDDLLSYPSHLEPYLNGYKKFLDHYKPEWKLIEQPLISKVWGFAGTPDRFGIINNKNVLIDIKSGSKEPSHQIQTGAYKILIEENSCHKVQERYSLYLKENDFRLIPHKNPADKTIFLGLAQAYRWKMKYNKIKECDK